VTPPKGITTWRVNAGVAEAERRNLQLRTLLSGTAQAIPGMIAYCSMWGMSATSFLAVISSSAPLCGMSFPTNSTPFFFRFSDASHTWTALSSVVSGQGKRGLTTHP
jgi:hypothetical protein